MTHSEAFKEFLKKIASGEKTSSALTRKESANALKMIMHAQATPAQIGAFMIAHRIRRPEPEELAGMLDTFLELGPTLKASSKHLQAMCFGMPFDGRKRTAPIYPLTSLVLLTAGLPIVLQGGRRMPIKYGVTHLELFQVLGLDLYGLNINTVQSGFNQYGFAVIDLPQHFPLADKLVPYRDELGKRPPLASMELLWTIHQGDHILISGFVHPPTEERAYKTLTLMGEKKVISVKGLEGSIDLPISRPCITGTMMNQNIERVILHPREYGFDGRDIEWNSMQEWQNKAIEALNNKGELKESLIWNAGVYLWFSGSANDIYEGMETASNLISSGKVLEKLNQLISWRSSYN